MAEPTAWAKTIIQRSVAQQRRQLRHGASCRHLRHAVAYQEQLDELRYDDPPMAAKLAKTVAEDLVLRIHGTASERALIHAGSLGILGSCYRIIGAFDRASALVLQALRVARAHQLREQEAQALIRAATIMRDKSAYDAALTLTSQAHSLFAQLEDASGCAQAMVDRGLAQLYSGDLLGAKDCFRVGLIGLPHGSGYRGLRYRLSALQGQAILAREEGDLAGADDRLAEALSIVREGSANWAKTTWLLGSVAFERGDHATAQQFLGLAFETLRDRQNLDYLLVGVDLVEALSAAGRYEDARVFAAELCIVGAAQAGVPIIDSATAVLRQALAEGDLARSRDLAKVLRQAAFLASLGESALLRGLAPRIHQGP